MGQIHAAAYTTTIIAFTLSSTLVPNAFRFSCRYHYVTSSYPKHDTNPSTRFEHAVKIGMFWPSLVLWACTYLFLPIHPPHKSHTLKQSHLKKR